MRIKWHKPARDGAHVGATGLARGRNHATRPWSAQEAYEGKDTVANEALATYFSQNRGIKVRIIFWSRHRAATVIS